MGCLCVCGGGGGVGGGRRRRRRRGNKFHRIKKNNNNPHVNIKCSILPNLFLFKPTFKCMQVLAKAKNLNTFILHSEFAGPLIKRVRVAIS